jgi:hypothetical protein
MLYSLLVSLFSISYIHSRKCASSIAHRCIAPSGLHARRGCASGQAFIGRRAASTCSLIYNEMNVMYDMPRMNERTLYGRRCCLGRRWSLPSSLPLPRELRRLVLRREHEAIRVRVLDESVGAVLGPIGAREEEALEGGTDRRRRAKGEGRRDAEGRRVSARVEDKVHSECSADVQIASIRATFVLARRRSSRALSTRRASARVRPAECVCLCD